ncbi:MAG TPA: 8-amino-7-oxononanoate synthase, partial [Deltaproteobacteria bacterium]|nr:8-amino-7-oxononanoate synthase [Deltaproteobacteria bacterium]
EDAVAQWLETEAALVCSSGYQANLAMVQGLCGAEDLILSDALNHASLIDGCRLSRARVQVLEHGEPGLSLGAHAEAGGQVFRLGEGLYSMDGDRGPVEDWVAAADAEKAGTSHVLIDEAHALGIFGTQGRGVCAERGVADRVLARVGTFGKALGAHGAFIACSRDTRELLVNTGRTYIFTTGLPPAAAGAALAAIGVVRSERGMELRSRLRGVVSRLRCGLAELGLEVVGDEDAPIVPVLVGPAEEAMQLYASLLEQGIYAMAIRPPTVPEGTCRLRFTVSAAHTDADVDTALRVLSRL